MDFNKVTYEDMLTLIQAKNLNDIQDAIIYLLNNSTDPVEIPEWAKQPEKPTYTAEEVGALSSSKWNGMRMGLVGDSQTEKNSHKSKVWYQHLTTALGMRAINVARSGRSIGNSSSPHGNFMERAKMLTRAVDLIFVLGGGNDVWFNTPMGEFGSTDNTTFYGAMDELCRYLMNKYPTKTIIFITPTEQNNESCNSNNTTGLTPTDFSQAMKKVCAKYAIPVIDSNSSCGIYPLDDKNASIYTTDKIHLNDAGHERLAQQVMSFVQSNCYVPEGGVNLAEYSINGVSQAYYTNDTLNLIVNKTYGGVALPNVIEMSVDLSCYSDALIAENGKGIGFFGFKQADGTYKVLSLYAGTNDVENEGLEVITGQSAILSSDLTNMSGLVRGGHWSAPTAKPQRADVVLENGTAKVYIDDSEVYSVTCEELAFITTTRFCDDLAGLTLTYADV